MQELTSRRDVLGLLLGMAIPIVPGFPTPGLAHGLKGAQAKPEHWMRRKTFSTESAVTCVAVSGNGKRILAGSTTGSVNVWDAESGKLLQTFRGRTGKIWSVSVSADGKRAISADYDAKLWDTETGKVIHEYDPGSILLSAAISGDGKLAATGSTRGNADVWDTVTGQKLVTLAGHRLLINSLVLTADGRFLLTASVDKTLIVWDVSSGKELRQTALKVNPLKCTALSADGSRILIRIPDETISLVEMKTGATLRTFSDNKAEARATALSADGKRAWIGFANRVILFDAETGRKLFMFEGHTDKISSLSLSADNKLLLTGSSDKTAILWQAGA